MYTIYDRKSGIYYPPMYFQNDQLAIRDLAKKMIDSNSMMGWCPEDYELWSLADYEDTTAEIKLYAKKRITTAEEILKFYERKYNEKPVDAKRVQ